MSKNGCNSLNVGRSFEIWIRQVISEHVTSASLTKYHKNPDIHFVKNNTPYLIECKCFTYHDRNGRVRHLTISTAQIRSLKNKLRNLDGGENKILFAVGLLFSEYDMVPFVVDMHTLLDHCHKTDDKHFVSLSWIARQPTLREWLHKEFGVVKDVALPRWNYVDC